MSKHALAALKAALKMFEKMTDAYGPYSYIDGTDLVSDAYDMCQMLKDAIDEAEGSTRETP